MGREARAKQERKKTRKAELWSQGVPTIVKLTPETFHRLRAANLELQLFEQRAVQLQTELRQASVAAMRAAGLEPGRTYRLSAEKLEAELVEG